MNLQQLTRVLQPAYAKRDPAVDWDRAERMARMVVEIRSQLEPTEAEVVDQEVVQALAYMAPLRDDIRRSLELRGRVEGFLVGEGWTDLQVRELFKSLENIGKPKSEEEKVVTDAETLTAVGALGFARGLMSAGHRGVSLEEALESLRKRLSNRLHTRPGQARIRDLREELRELLDRVQRAR